MVNEGLGQSMEVQKMRKDMTKVYKGDYFRDWSSVFSIAHFTVRGVIEIMREFVKRSV